jgi:CheY-like chemotaxis protein
MPRILLVEDNEMNRDMLCRRLQRRGYEMLLAEDGERGVELAHSEQPDLVLMDLSLPVMDGWEATRHIKSDRQSAHIPVIALTAHALAGDRQEALDAGCDDFDTKPVELQRLLDKIERLLAGAASGTEPAT